MSKIVTVNKDDCTSCGHCVDSAPNYFRFDADDLAESHNNKTNLNAAVVEEADYDKVDLIIEDCLGECISWK